MAMDLPPELMAAISGGAPGGAPADAGPPAPASGADNLQFLQDAIESAKHYVDGEDDEVHKQTALQCIAKLQSILAEEQKGSDDLLQGKPNPRALRRAASGPAV